MPLGLDINRYRRDSRGAVLRHSTVSSHGVFADRSMMHDRSLRILFTYLHQIVLRLDRLLHRKCCCTPTPTPPPDDSVAAGFTFSLSIQPKEIDMPVELALSTEEDALIVCTPVTKAGKPAKVDGPISFTTDNPLATVTQQSDTSALISTPGTAGDVVVTVSADADLGAGVTTVSDTAILHVADPQAANLGLVATAQPKPAQP